MRIWRGYEPIVVSAGPPTWFSGGVDAFANLRADYVYIVGEGASLVVPRGLVLYATRSILCTGLREI